MTCSIHAPLAGPSHAPAANALNLGQVRSPRGPLPCFGFGRAKWIAPLLGLLVVTAPYSALRAALPGLECFAVNDLERVFEDGYGSQEPPLAVLSLFGLRHEFVSGQCVVLAHTDLEGLTISVSPLRQVQGAGMIPEQNIRWNFVEGIFIEKNSPNRQSADLLRAAPAWFPDVLSEEPQCSLPNGARKAVYLTLDIPRDAPPGEYHASLSATAGGVSASLPLVLQVYPLALPEQRHLFVTEWFSTSAFRTHHHLNPSDPQQFDRMLKL